MVDWARHGANCCGIKHIYGFGYPTQGLVAQLDECIREIKENGEKEDPDECLLMEAVINEIQKEEEGWGKILKDRGFRCVSKFKNANSGNKVYVYHHYKRCR